MSTTIHLLCQDQAPTIDRGDHEISICQDQLIFVSQRPRHIFYQAEKSLPSRWNMGAMLVKQQIRQKNEPGG